MTKIYDLIEKFCPNGVEYKTINDICCNVFSGGTPKTTNDEYYGGNIPWLRSGEINFNEVTDAEIKITEKGLNESSAKLIKPKSVLIALTGATVARSAVNEIAITANQSVCAMEVSDNVNYKFLYYTIANKYNEIKGLAQGALTSINLGIIKSIKIAVPPLEVQDEIVHVLDDFMLLSAELSAELKARQKQYEYYRNSLLKNYDEVEKVFLKDVAEYSKERINASKLNDSNYVGVDNLLQNKMGKTNSSHTPKTGNSTKYNKGDILIGNIRPYLKKIWFADNDGGTNGDVLAIHVKSNKVIPEYLYYILSSDCFFNYDNSNSKGAKMPRGNKDAVMNYKFYLPNIDEQRKIISILGKFEIITNDITKGLPAEIEARQKQYEYYRNKLLTFKELVNEG